MAIQRTRLQVERDEIAAERGALAAECRDLQSRVTLMREAAEELERTRIQRDVIALERDELKVHVDQLDAKTRSSLHQLELRSAQLAMCWVRPGHFYSPVVDPADSHALRMHAEALDECPPGISIDELQMVKLIRTLSTHYSSLRPACVIEVGCGYSSCVLMDTNDRFLAKSAVLTFIDPHPEALEQLLDPTDPYRQCLRSVRLQDTPIELFESLEENDILFLDSSHVAKTGSDVNDYCSRILPRLRPGVIVHIHDIFWPFEYPSSWINRSWNETYILRAFLQFNREFEILLFNDLLYRRHRAVLTQCMPLCARHPGGSIWLRKVGG